MRHRTTRISPPFFPCIAETCVGRHGRMICVSFFFVFFRRRRRRRKGTTVGKHFTFFRASVRIRFATTRSRRVLRWMTMPVRGSATNGGRERKRREGCPPSLRSFSLSLSLSILPPFLSLGRENKWTLFRSPRPLLVWRSIQGNTRRTAAFLGSNRFRQ